VDTVTARPAATGTGQAAFERGGALVRPAVALGELVRRRPAGVTAHQWSTALRTRFAYVVYAGAAPAFAADLRAPGGRAAEQTRTDRLTGAVCAAAGLALLRVTGAALGTVAARRRVVEYVLDARAYQAVTARLGQSSGVQPGTDGYTEPVGYRDIQGRLPDGRTGPVNDLGALARAQAIEAYADRRLADPIIRNLHVTWPDGSAEGWAWLRPRAAEYLLERAVVASAGVATGLAPDRLAQDLATAAIGAHLARLDAADLPLVPRDRLAADFDGLRARQRREGCDFRFDHVTFD